VNEAVANLVASGAPDPTPLERHIPKMFKEWADDARKTLQRKDAPRTETIRSGPERLTSSLKPFFRYINDLIEAEVFG
jgi:hypothetical protein